MFRILFHPRALKNLNRFHSKDRQRVIAKIILLSKGSANKNLDIKKLANTKASYRLRIGNIRALYEVDKNKHTIFVWDVDYRGNIY